MLEKKFNFKSVEIPILYRYAVKKFYKKENNSNHVIKKVPMEMYNTRSINVGICSKPISKLFIR